MNEDDLIDIEISNETQPETDQEIERPNQKLALKILLEKKALVLEGGGVLGTAHAGALTRLFELGGMEYVENFTGTSVGSIISAALALGARSEFIRDTLFNLNFKRFQDGGNIIRKAFRFLFKYGMHKGDEIERFSEEFIKNLCGNSNITFLEAYKTSGNHLTITYLSLKNQKTKYADYITTPNLPIKTAIRWSSTIPLFFQPSRVFNRRKLLNMIVDGGVADNYPIHVPRDQGFKSSNILGFKLCDEKTRNEYKSIKDDTVDQDIDFPLPKGIKNYAWTLVDILRAQALRYHVHKEDWKLTCKIDIGKYNTTDFGLTESDKLWLFNSGRNAIDKHLLEIENLLDNNLYPL